ncbi:MAG: (d)CMP kinase [Pseudomonadota bacterium]
MPLRAIVRTTSPKLFNTGLTVKKKLIIAIDGPSGAGKSTVGKILAKRTNYTYIDTGAMYRAVALRTLEKNIDINDEDRLAQICSGVDISFRMENGSLRVLLNSKDVTEAIRASNLSLLASSVSAKRVVRDALLGLQRKLGENGGVIMEGRDVGTVVFPDADIKFYLDASPAERGKRRYTELRTKGEKVSLTRVTREIIQRDLNDSSREYAPLKPAGDAINIDSSNKTIEQVVEELLEIIRGVTRCYKK